MMIYICDCKISLYAKQSAFNTNKYLALAPADRYGARPIMPQDANSVSDKRRLPYLEVYGFTMIDDLRAGF